MTRIATGLAGLLLMAEGTVWALPMQWDGTTEAAPAVSQEVPNAGTAGPASTVMMGLDPAPERGATVLLGFGLLGIAVYSKRRRNAKQS